MNSLSEYDKQRVAELVGCEAFVLVAVDSKLPCEEALAGERCDGSHEYATSVHQLDHRHAVSMLGMARKSIMENGIKDE